jgi:hypothetical protein
MMSWGDVVVGTKAGGIHDGESFANRGSHSEIEVCRFVGWGFVLGFALGKYGLRTGIWGLV